MEIIAQVTISGSFFFFFLKFSDIKFLIFLVDIFFKNRREADLELETFFVFIGLACFATFGAKNLPFSSIFSTHSVSIQERMNASKNKFIAKH